MNTSQDKWTGHIKFDPQFDLQVVLAQLVQAFNASPFLLHNMMQMRLVDGEIQAYIEMQPSLIGNAAFQILHGGVAATVLDSIGGIVAMGELYKQASADTLPETTQKVARLATVDMRVDYLAPGRGQYFTATAEVLRLGRKSCTMRMLLINDQGQSIAAGIASYAY
ncbi:thioesterase family protein [Acinetobacter larvae]|uniref:Thioesterase domain-containing protein n=1 Tax=Acinetobacter larvae TaxID=1789224 RepID=A0A1B2M214_9GAMM|nr:thioesterase family protein [Acinetobacter larvae]AOA59063.1 hypothetical protein BFG52_12350 [Acinetobacter larvae]